MKKFNIHLKYLGLFLLFFILIFCYSFFFSVVYNDEIWNYGFSYNIASGMIPYRDFNMIVTPLYSYFGSFFLRVFGNYLFSLHIFNALVISAIFLIAYMRMGLKSIILIPIVLLNGYSNYNIFCVFLLFVILTLNDSKFSNKELMISFVVGLCLLTKQTLGICLFVPMFYYNKDKIKSIISFMIPILLFIIYLFFTNSFYQFVDYCFLGLFDFGQSNSISFFLPLEIVVCFCLVFKLIKCKFKSSSLFYLLMFQVITVPICDDYHFMMGIIPVLYYFINHFDIEYYQIKHFFIISFFFAFMWLFVVHDYESINLYPNSNSYLYGRNISLYVQECIDTISNYINNNRSRYDYVYFFSKNSYYVKLNSKYKLSKYDLINNGNMGYNGSVKYINEIDSYCNEHKCMFILLKDEFDGNSQTNKNLVNYVKNTYGLVEETDLLIVYSNVRR